jgi:hypothetical protein
MSTGFTCPHCGMSQHVAPASLPPGAVCPGCGRPLHSASVAPGVPPPPVVYPADTGYADDSWEQPEPAARLEPTIPGSVRAAGIIWIVFGALILLSGGLQLLAQLALAPTEARGAFFSGAVCGALFVGFVGGVFIHVGVQSLSGTARDTLGNGIGSIIFAALIGGITLVVLVAAASVRSVRGEATPGWAVVIPLVINSLAAFGLLAAGVLALVGRQGYREYRRYHYPATWRRR